MDSMVLASCRPSLRPKTFTEMAEVLHLTAQDLEISDAEFCQLTGSCSGTKSSGTYSYAGTPIEDPKPLVSEVEEDSSSYETSSRAPWEQTSQSSPTDIKLSPHDPTWVPGKISCNGILASGLASIALRPEDLESWSTNEIIDCIGILGLIEWPLETKLEVWRVIRTKLVS